METREILTLSIYAVNFTIMGPLHQLNLRELMVRMVFCPSKLE